MHRWNLETWPCPPALLIPDGEGSSYLSPASFESGNTFVADFPLCLEVVIDSKFETIGMVGWRWIKSSRL